MQKLTYNVNNGGILELIQNEHDGAVTISGNNHSGAETISAGDMVMLINFYRYVKNHDIQNDFINPNGKAHE